MTLGSVATSMIIEVKRAQYRFDTTTPTPPTNIRPPLDNPDRLFVSMQRPQLIILSRQPMALSEKGLYGVTLKTREPGHRHRGQRLACEPFPGQ